MTDRAQDHAPFDELAAGHVLHALEPDDEQLFLSHARDCPRCLDTLAGFRDVAAALAEAAAPAEPSPDLGARIMAAALSDLPVNSRHEAGAAGTTDTGAGSRPDTAGTGTSDAGVTGTRATGTGTGDAGVTGGRVTGTGNGDAGATGTGATGTGTGDVEATGTGTSGTGVAGTGPTGAGTGGQGRPEAGTEAAEQPLAPVVPLARRAVPRWLRPVTAAAAVALIAAGGVWAGLDITGGHPAPTVASCSHERGCSVVTLAAAGRPAAKVIVMDGRAWMVPVSIRADNTAEQIYVLWQITGKTPRAIGSFDVHTGSDATIKIGNLPAPYHDTSAFAISLEHGRTIPHLPTKVVAAGAIS